MVVTRLFFPGHRASGFVTRNAIFQYSPMCTFLFGDPHVNPFSTCSIWYEGITLVNGNIRRAVNA